MPTQGPTGRPRTAGGSAASPNRPNWYPTGTQLRAGAVVRSDGAGARSSRAPARARAGPVTSRGPRAGPWAERTQSDTAAGGTGTRPWAWPVPGGAGTGAVPAGTAGSSGHRPPVPGAGTGDRRPVPVTGTAAARCRARRRLPVPGGGPVASAGTGPVGDANRVPAQVTSPRLGSQEVTGTSAWLRQPVTRTHPTAVPVRVDGAAIAGHILPG
jgi:hypothetical protein